MEDHLPGPRLTCRSAGIALGALCLAGSAAAQIRPAGRLDLAILNPDSAKAIHITYDIGVGASLGRHSTFLFDVTRQNLSGMIQGYGASWQTYVGGVWEYAFGDYQERYRRQFTVGGRAGALLSSGPVSAAPYLGVAVGFRYPIASAVRVQGRLEGIASFPPPQLVGQCDAYGDCGAVHIGGRAQMNYGLFLGMEVQP